MNLFGKLLFARNHSHLRPLDAGEAEPVFARRRFQWLHYHVTNSDVQVESREDARIHASFDGITVSIT
jgi:hypothetical protein